MAERSVPELNEALELIASLEAQCEELRRIGVGNLHEVPLELKALLAEIRDEISTMMR